MSDGSHKPEGTLDGSHDETLSRGSAFIIVSLEWLPCVINVQSKKKKEEVKFVWFIYQLAYGGGGEYSVPFSYFSLSTKLSVC